jgi:hypothetical protein
MNILTSVDNEPFKSFFHLKYKSQICSQEDKEDNCPQKNIYHQFYKCLKTTKKDKANYLKIK